MANSVRFTVMAQPVPKARPRLARGHVYTPPRTVAAEKQIAWEFKRAAGPSWKVTTAPIMVCLSFHTHNRQHGDLDNLVKTVCDALNGVAWADDRQIHSLRADLFTASRPARIEAEIREL